MLENQVTNDVQKQFLRRTPIKLKQFARFLGDIVNNQVDDIRIKALLSQVIKTRESCIEQKFEPTAKILNQLIKQLSMNRESFQTQKPLLLRLAKRFADHAEKLSLGIKPQKKSLKIVSPVKNLKAKQKENIEILEPFPPKNDFTEETVNDLGDINEELKIESESPVEIMESNELDSLSLYNDKSQLIFLTNGEYQSAVELEHYQGIFSQLKSMGIDYFIESRLEACFEKSNLHENSIIIAPLNSAEELKVLDDEAVENKNTPLIFTANEDNQENRLKAIRNRGTGYVIEPLSISSLFEQVDISLDLNFEMPSRILVMEDSKAQARYYEKVLQKGHFDIRVVNNPEILLEAIRGFDPETILMDMQMPGSSGVELTQMIRQMPRYAHLPIIFLSAEENLRKQNQALMSGGTAFIVKPVQKEQLMFMARLHTQKFRSLSPQIDINPDTNAAYPIKFKQIISSEAARATRSNTRIGLVLIQLDKVEDLIQNSQFSFINNAVNQLTQLLKKRLRQTDIIGHIDVNRLGVILTSGDKKYWTDVMYTIQEQFANLSFNLDQQSHFLSVSMGISEVERNFSAHQWLERSNQALEEAIQNGSSQINWK